jgi:PASTA domain
MSSEPNPAHQPTKATHRIGLTGADGFAPGMVSSSGHRRWGRRWGAGLVAVAVVSAVMAVSGARPASGALVDGASFPEEFPLRTAAGVAPGPAGTVVEQVRFVLQAGQSRRVSDQLTITLSNPRGGHDDAEVDNNLECVDPATNEVLTDTVGGGTNYPKSGAGPLSMRASLLFTAPHAGTFACRIRPTTSDDTNTSYQMTALAGTWPTGTWLELDNFTADPPSSWSAPFCGSQGVEDGCIYLGQPVWGSNPATAVLYEDDTTWQAAPDAVTADLVGHMQITSCYNGTASCPPIEWGDSSWLGGPADDDAVFRTHLELIQLDQSGQPCHVTSSRDVQYTISNRAHHFLVDYDPGQIDISATCGGSRTFKLRSIVTWISGNPVKIESGANTNANIIVTTTAPTRPVPDVVGTDQDSATARIQHAGLTLGNVTPIVDFAAPGTVLAQNSPAQTVEPQRSPVDLTVSLGAATVPTVTGTTVAEATRSVGQAGLTADVSYQKACIEPGHVLHQAPSPQTVLAPGSTVRIFVDSGTLRTCGPLK